MELEKQVVSLKLAKEMKKLGFAQLSLFYHNKILPPEWEICSRDKLMAVVDNGEHGGWTFLEEGLSCGDVCSAHSVAELGEMLPYCLSVKKRTRTSHYFLSIEKLELDFVVKYNNKKSCIYVVIDKKEADARAKMLIHLRKNNLI